MAKNSPAIYSNVYKNMPYRILYNGVNDIWYAYGTLKSKSKHTIWGVFFIFMHGSIGAILTVGYKN